MYGSASGVEFSTQNLPQNVVKTPIALENIPDEIKNRLRWVLWRYESVGGRSVKMPLNPRKRFRANISDCSTWGSLDEALTAYNANPDNYNGVGFVLCGDDGYCGLDLDKCRDHATGVIESWADGIIRRINSYTEVSPSGRGIRILCRAVKPGPRCRNGRFEVYDSKRFVTLTGHHLSGTPSAIRHRDEEVGDIYTETFDIVEDRDTKDLPVEMSNWLDGTDDDWIVASAQSARNGTKVTSLWEGRWQGAYPSQSEADLALCSMLAFWCGPNREQIDRLFRKSALMREKWDREDYARRTIERAISETDFYISLVETQPVGACIIDAKDPFKVAESYLHDRYTDQGRETLVFHDGQWLLWTGTQYAVLPEEQIRSNIWKWLATCLQSPRGRNGDRLKPFKPTRAVVAEVAEALKSQVILSPDTSFPSWRDGREGSKSIIAFRNGLLDLATYLATGEPKLIPHTPDWLSTTCLPHDFDVDARCPQWLQFLDAVSGGDQEWIDCLAMWFGYCLTADVSQQKLAMFAGRPRSGKGTTMAVLTALLGADNVATPRLSSLADRFALASLVGKLAAVIGEGHLGRQSDSVAVLERLKSIVGGDRQNVEQKFRPEQANVLISARFTVAVNELPRLPDASVALVPRLLVFPFEVSFEGREDVNLQERLLAEVSGITNWAIVGLRRLRETGRLVQPRAGLPMLNQFRRLSASIHAFLEDQCEVGTGLEVRKDQLRAEWAAYCQEMGLEAGSDISFSNKLFSSGVGISAAKSSRDEDGKQHHVFRGVALNAVARGRNDLGL